jgi:hypothetical protein
MGKQNPTATKKSVKMDELVDKIAKPRKVVTHYIKPDDPKQFNRHLQKRKPNLDFRFRPSIGNSSLLARRSRTNTDQLAASTSGSLVPTNGNFVDLVTPEPPTPHNNLMDSGYISLNSTASPPGCDSGSSIHDIHGRVNARSPPPPVGIPITTDPENLPEYRATMEQTTEQIFFQKYVAKNFTYDSRKAREQLKPVMRKALDRMEDRPIVDKFYLHVNFKKNTLWGEHRRERLRKKPGQRAVDWVQASYEPGDYMSAR